MAPGRDASGSARWADKCSCAGEAAQAVALRAVFFSQAFRPGLGLCRAERRWWRCLEIAQLLVIQVAEAFGEDNFYAAGGGVDLDADFLG